MRCGNCVRSCQHPPPSNASISSAFATLQRDNSYSRFSRNGWIRDTSNHVLKSRVAVPCLLDVAEELLKATRGHDSCSDDDDVFCLKGLRRTSRYVPQLEPRTRTSCCTSRSRLDLPDSCSFPCHARKTSTTRRWCDPSPS